MATFTTLATGVYRSYLVRFWQSTEQGCWRASAQCVQTGSTLLFGDVESLLAFLQQEFVKKGNHSPLLTPPSVGEEQFPPLPGEG